MADDQVGRFMNKRFVLLDTCGAFQVEIDTSMDAATTKVAVERTVVAVLVEKRSKLPKVAAEFVWRDRGVFPSFPRVRLSGNARSRAEAGFANFPDQLLLSRVVVHFHRGRSLTPAQVPHHPLGFLIGFLGSLASEFNEKETFAVREKLEISHVQSLLL